MPNSNSSSKSSSSYKGSRCPSPSQATASVASREQTPSETPNFHPLIHTPPPARAERRLPARTGSTASLLSPFASLTRRLGAKHKNKGGASSARSTPNPMSAPLFPPPPASQASRSTTPALSLYSTLPRSGSSPMVPPSPLQTPLINQLLAQASEPSPPETPPRPLLFNPGAMGLTEVLDEPVEEEGGDRVTWEYHHVGLNRVPGYGFGIAVSGGRDNPHFANGDPSIAISDVIKGGPAEGKLQINDRVLSVNGVSLENVDYGTAVQVLRDSGATVNLVVKRRIVSGASGEAQTYKVTLTKSKKKDDFGITLGCRLYLKELTNKALIEREGGGAGSGTVLQEGDIILKINSTPAEGLSLKEAKKLIESCKDKLQLTIKRDTSVAVTSPGNISHHSRPSDPNVFDPSATYSKETPTSGGPFANYDARPNYSNQNLYVQPPTRGGSVDYRNPLTPQPTYEDKSNLARMAGRSRGPLMDVSLSQLDQPINGRQQAEEGDDAPPRPPPPRAEDYYGTRRTVEESYKPPTLEPRFISFQKEGSVGIRVTGGNQVGIFVTAVQPGSPAALQGLVPGDKILKVNDMEMNGVTREEAVLFLLSLQDQIELVVQHKKEEYDQVVASGTGDSFYVKTHFNYEQPASGHIAFRKGEVFHVVDTLYKGVVGSWQAFRVGPNGQDLQQGIIPNSAAAEELATAQFNAAKKEAASAASESRGSFFRRRRATHRRSKSLGRDHWDDVVFAETLSKFPAYERVVLRHPGFIRPVVFFGPIGDLAREKLIKDYPDKFSSPQVDGNRENENPAITSASGRSGIVRLSAIRELVEKGRHALVDITPGAVDKLNYAQFYPVVIFLRPDSKHTVKELRTGLPNLAPRLELFKRTAHKSSKKLYEQCVKLEKLWSHIFTTVVPITQRDTWYRKLREAIDREQNQAIWVSETKLDEYLSDDFLFPMTSRLSYASSPESDLDLSPEPRPVPAATNLPTTGPKSPPSPTGRLVKSSSDPSIATQDDLGVSLSIGPPGPKFHAPPPYGLGSASHHMPMETSTPNKRRSQGGDSKYGFSGPGTPSGPHKEMGSSRSPRSSYNPQNYNYSPAGRGYPNGTPHQQQRFSQGNPSGYPSHYQQQQQQQSYPQYHQQNPNAPELPPKIDRTSKPRMRSAQERLFGSREGDPSGSGKLADPETYSSPPPPAPPNGNHSHQTENPHGYGGSLRGNPMENDRANPKTGSYDSSSSYDSYNRLGLVLSLAGVNQGHSDPTTPGSPTTGGVPRSPHDPYRYTRSTSQPVRSPTEPSSPSKYRSQFDQPANKPSPPPKTSVYKPVPPPKPKNYRPPPNSSQSQQQSQQSSGSNYWNHSPPGTLNPSRAEQHNYYNHQPSASTNGNANGHFRYDEDVNGFDSGHGSSLDRHSYGGAPLPYGKAPPPPPPVNGSQGHSRNNQAGQYYYNIPPPREQSREANRLDLAQHRDQRGSAFELYKKPADPRSPSHSHYAEHNARRVSSCLYGEGEALSPSQSPIPPTCSVIAAVKGWFTSEGGRLESIETGVALIVPPGALPAGPAYQIYFRVCRDHGQILPLNKEKGETLLSPLVQCGPRGLQFLRPVELRLPHAAGGSSGTWNVSVKTSETLSSWNQTQLLGQDDGERDGNVKFVSVFIDHF